MKTRVSSNKWLLPLIVLLISFTNAYASELGTPPNNEIWYTSSDGATVNPYAPEAFGERTILSNTYQDGKGVITFDGTIDSVGYMAFQYCETLTSITLPNNVASIGERAFLNCSSLTSITIPNSVTHIEYWVFRGCSSLNSITIPSSVISINESFEGCNSLESITVAADNSVYDSRNNCNAIIETATNTLILGCKNTSIPNTITAIGESAFSNNSSLTSITIPNSVTSIGERAFLNCSSLTSITIPNSVTSIGESAFWGCESFASITIPKSVTSIGDDAFNCRNLKSITVTSGNSVYDSRNNCNAIIETATNTLIRGCKNTTIPNGVISIAKHAFQYCINLTSIIIPNSVVTIGTEAFYSCFSLSSITIGNNVTRIEDGAFSGCALNSVNIPNSVTHIGEYAFSNCDMVSVSIPEGITSISKGTFWDCRNMASITIPNSVTSIGEAAFRFCSSLSAINIPNSVTSIGSYAFGNNSSIKSVTIHSGVTSIGRGAFAHCYSLDSIVVESGNNVYDSRENCNAIIETATNILIAGCKNTTILDGIKGIGEVAFAGCSFSSIAIPNSVTNIGEEAFAQCALTTIIIPSSVTSIKKGTFNNCSNLTSIVIPNSVVNIEAMCFEMCHSLTTVTIPNSVTSIGEGAFSYCFSLSSITCEAATPPNLIGEEYEFSFYRLSDTIPVYVPCESLDAYKTNEKWAYFTNIQCIAEEQYNKIRYTSTDGNIVTPYNVDAFGANIVSNTYENGQGIITFDGPVTTIGDNAFYNCETLSSMEFGKNLKTIGQSAFYSTALRSAIFHEGLDSIGNTAFWACDKLKIVSIPSSVRHIYTKSGKAFQSCNAIDSIYWNAHNCPDVPFTSTNNANVRVVVFGDSITRIPNDFCQNFTKLTTIVLPSTIEHIGSSAFQGCKILSSSISLDNVVTIADNAFHSCDSLRVVEFGKNLKTIGQSAFYSTDLRSAIFHEGLDSIGNTAFWACDKLKIVSIPSSVRHIYTKSGKAFQSCNAIDSIYWNAHNCPDVPFISSENANVRVVVFGDSITRIPNNFCKDFDNLTTVVLPSTIEHIGSSAFQGCKILSSSISLDNVVTIADNAFSSCDSLRVVEFGKNLKTIGQSAFYSTNLRSAIFHEGLDSIGNTSFGACDSLRVVSIPSSVRHIYTKSGKAFQSCNAIDSIYWNAHNCPDVPFTSTNNANVRVVVFGDSITRIPSNFCNRFTNLSKIILPDTIGIIGEKAFYQCTKLSNIDFGRNLKIIEKYAFYSCDNLRTITFPEKLDSIAADAFNSCDSLRVVSVPYSVRYIEPTSGNQGAFQYCNAIDSIYWNANNCTTSPFQKSLSSDLLGTTVRVVVFGDSITHINDQFCKGFKNLSKVIFPMNLNSIGSNAFYGCEKLTSLTFPHTVTDINESAFSNCKGLQSINSWGNVKVIRESAFQSCISLRSVILPIGIDSIESRAFYNCDSLRVVSIPSSINFIEDGWNMEAFYGCHSIDSIYWNAHNCNSRAFKFENEAGNEMCTNLRVIVFGDSITHINDQFCKGFKNLSKVIFPMNLNSIGSNAFYGCEKLTSLTFPHTVTDINESAFSNCSSLTTLYANPLTPPSLGSSAFANTSLNEIYVQCGSTNAYKSSAWNTYCTNFIEPEVLYTVSLHSADTTQGQVIFDKDPSCDNTAIIRAIPSSGYRFTTWNDGVTTNPRTLLLSQDTTFTANFELMLLDAEYATICYGESYTWDKNGQTYTEAGTYTTITSEGEVTLHLTILPEVPITNDSATICHGETYTWNGQTYSAAGEYSITLSNALGCDSVATLHLTIMPEATTTTETIVIGSDELPYTWRGNTYSATGRYTVVEQYTTVACDSAIHVLDLTVLTTGNHDEQSVTICETEAPYVWYGESYSATGKYTYTEKYVGTDIDSIQHILNLTVNPTVYTEEHITACDSYEWNGETYTASGDYTYTTTAANGCDSIVILHLTINNTQYAEESVIACDSYAWNGETYTQSGEYVYTTTASNGCDSIVTLHLTINQTQYAEETIIACDSYAWNGETYTASGEYVYTTVAANGCDSIVTLQLTINQTQYAGETVIACDSYVWNGETYTQSGEYVYTTTVANGCDSIVTLHLTINNTQYAEESIIACDSYVWNGETYTQSGDYTYTTTAANGCDSIVTLHLTINQTQYAEETIIACDSYEWNGQTYTQSGEYTYTTVAANGCDSIVTLHLTINQSEVGATEYATICYGETYTWNGQTYSTAGEYSITLSNALGCDSVATLLLTILPEAVTLEESVTLNEEQLPYIWRGQSYDHAGVYTISEPFANYPYCDSVIYVLNLTIEAPNKCGDNLYWHYSNNTLSITGSGAMYDNPNLLSYRNQPWYPERVNHIVLPDAITHIGNVAFADCANLTNIVIPSSVTSIGDGAFSWTGLQSVTIPASVTDLGEQVFETCNNLHTILYEGTPSSISNQTVHPFIGCVHLDTIITPAALWHCTTADPMLEARYGVPHKARYIEVTDGELTKQAMKYIAKNSGTVEVLDLSAATNTTLPLGALLNNYRLSTLYLPEQIEVIPEMLAEGCYSLLEILIPANVTEIGNYAFAGCTNVWRMMVEAVLPPKVYDKTFDGIDRSISLIVPAGSEDLYRQAEYWKEFFIDDTHNQSPKSNCQKILHEDHILILREGKVYTTMGQLVK